MPSLESGQDKPVRGACQPGLSGKQPGAGLHHDVIAVPLSLASGALTWASRGLQVLAGLIAVGIGVHIMVETGARLFA